MHTQQLELLGPKKQDTIEKLVALVWTEHLLIMMIIMLEAFAKVPLKLESESLCQNLLLFCFVLFFCQNRSYGAPWILQRYHH